MSIRKDASAASPDDGAAMIEPASLRDHGTELRRQVLSGAT